MAAMKIAIDENLCTACEKCVDIVPQVFQMGDDIAYVVQPIQNGYNSEIEQAIDECPSNAIYEVPLP